VIATGKNPATLEAARASLRGIAEVVASDSGDAAQIEALFARVARERGGLDIPLSKAALRSSLAPWSGQRSSRNVVRRLEMTERRQCR